METSASHHTSKPEFKSELTHPNSKPHPPHTHTVSLLFFSSLRNSPSDAFRSSELPVQFLCLLLFGFKGTLGAEQLIHWIHDLLHFPGQIRVALLQLVLLLPQVHGRTHQLGGLVAAVAPQLLHVRQQHLHALHQLLQPVGGYLKAGRVQGPGLGVVWGLGLGLRLWLWLWLWLWLRLHSPAVAALKALDTQVRLQWNKYLEEKGII